MPYETLATSRTAMLVVYLIDVSYSMSQPLGCKRRIDVVSDAITAALQKMVFRSTKGAMLAPRYRIAMLAYSDHVYDVYGGIKTVDQAARMGIPDLPLMRTTETAKAYEAAEKLLQAELPGMHDCPAPLVCHMTDGEYTGADPEPIAKRLMKMAVPDGRVLSENIFISDRILPHPVADPFRWAGILPDQELSTDYGNKLKNMSSVIPESYRGMMAESNYRLKQGARMLFPGTSAELVAMGFQMSAATPVR